MWLKAHVAEDAVEEGGGRLPDHLRLHVAGVLEEAKQSGERAQPTWLQQQHTDLATIDSHAVPAGSFSWSRRVSVSREEGAYFQSLHVRPDVELQAIRLFVIPPEKDTQKQDISTQNQRLSTHT